MDLMEEEEDVIDTNILPSNILEGIQSIIMTVRESDEGGLWSKLEKNIPQEMTHKLEILMNN